MNIAALTIPAIFTAVDRLTAPFKHMNSAVSGFARNAEVAAARADRAFNKMLPSFGSKTNEVVDYAKGIATVATAAQAITFSATSILDYEEELANLKALTGATGEQFEGFKLQIAEVADESKKSSVDVVKAFGSIANNMPELLDNAKDLSDVTKASILLGKAARMETEAAGLAVTDILKQYGKGAESAGKFVDMLAAGSVAGSSEINDTQEALKKFGTVAANMNVTPLESIASIELVSKFEKGAEAGTKLRNILVKMSEGNLLPAKSLEILKQYGVDINKVSNSSIPFTERLKEIAKISGDSAAIAQVFGSENLGLATGFIKNAALLPDYISKVDSVGEATRMAKENTNTLRNKLAETVNTFVTYITTLQKTSFGLKIASGFLGWLADNMGWILDIAVPLLGILIGVKAAIWGIALVSKAAAAWTFAYEIAAGIATITNGTYATSLLATEGGLYALAIASGVAEAAQWALNVAMTANPIGLIIAAIVAIIAVIAVVIKYWDDWGASLMVFLGPIGFVISAFQSLRKNWDMVKAAFTSGGILGGLKAIGRVLLDAVLMPVQQLLGWIGKLTGADWAKNGVAKIQGWREGLGVDTSVKQTSTMPAVSSKVTEQNTLYERIQESSKKEKIELSYNNMPSNVNVAATAGIAVKGTTTMMGGNL
jgi:TP901 family phage tail tape measure protein